MGKIPNEWAAYAALQAQCSASNNVNVEHALDAGMNAFLQRMEPEVIVKAAAAGARRERYRASLRRQYLSSDIVANDHDALAARSCLRLLQARVSKLDWRVATGLGQGFDYADIANVEGISPGALRVRISRMRAQNAELYLAA